MDYKSSGVDVKAGRAFVEQIKSSVESTFRPEVLGGLGGFGGLIRLPSGLSKPVLVSGTDGVGTKLELAQDYQHHYGVGLDLVAMCINDVITTGAEPLFFLDYIATGVLGPQAMSEVINGIASGCKECGCALLGGETAEMPGFYPKGRYDLAGFCVGVIEESALIDGKKIRPGNKIIGLSSSGIHSNGFSLVREIISMNNVNRSTSYGKDKIPLIESILKPTFLYTNIVRRLIKNNFSILGMAHITGGGLPENLPRCLPKGLIAHVDKSSWPRPEIYNWLQENGEVPEVDLWNTFNLGIGYCLIVSDLDVPGVLNTCTDEGFSAWEIGKIIEKPSSEDKKLILGIPY
tara:strand:+ start:3152 stop:4192 length:1041 start_codon:yes stop_codon:yes gene_type:complete